MTNDTSGIKFLINKSDFEKSSDWFIHAPSMALQPKLKGQTHEGNMLDEYCTGIDPLPDNDTMRVPLVAVFPHPYHGRLVEKVVLMVSHMFNYKGIRYRFAWKNSGVAYYFPEAAPQEETVRPYPAGFQKKKGQMELPFLFE